MVPSVLTVADLDDDALAILLARFGLELEIIAPGAVIPGSYWGDCEAGIVAQTVFARPDTPVHSVLHEACHTVCMTQDRRAGLHTDAGGDDLEETAVCYLQVLLADELEAVGRERLLVDMDAWGYSFRLGNAASWFHNDAEDVRVWLEGRGLVDVAGAPSFTLRR